MRAVRFERFGPPPEVARCVAVPDSPPPGPGEVSIAMLAMPIDPADLLTIEGRYGVRPKLPRIAGAEGIGRIEAVGDGVRDLAVGDLVVPLITATWAERLTAKAALVIPVPSSVDLLQASLLKANPATAQLMLTDLVSLAAGDWLIQNAAASSVGQYVCRLARRRGIRTVNVVRSPGSAAIVREAGGDIVLVDDGTDAAAFADAVGKETGGVEPRLALDAVGGGATAALAAAVAPGATIASYGLLSGEACRIDSFHLVFRDVRLVGFWLATWFRTADRQRIRALYDELLPLLAAGELSAAIAATYPLDQVGDALRHAAAAGRMGKILLTANPGAGR